MIVHRLVGVGDRNLSKRVILCEVCRDEEELKFWQGRGINPCLPFDGGRMTSRFIMLSIMTCPKVSLMVRVNRHGARLEIGGIVRVPAPDASHDRIKAVCQGHSESINSLQCGCIARISWG
jgi:hypothetical protein